MQIGKSDVSQRLYPVIAFIKARDIMKLLAPACDENGFAFHGNFFQGLEAIGNKTGADNIYPPRALLTKLFQRKQQCMGLTIPPGQIGTGNKSDICLHPVQAPRPATARFSGIRNDRDRLYPGCIAALRGNSSPACRVCRSSASNRIHFVPARRYNPDDRDNASQCVGRGYYASFPIARILHRMPRRCCWKHTAGRAATPECARSPVASSAQHLGEWKDCRYSWHIPPSARGELDALRQDIAQQLSLASSMYLQRRAFRHPDLGILFRRFSWAGVKYDAVQNQPPRPPRNFHYPWIAQELLEVRPQRLGGRSIRRTEIDQQYTCLVWCTVLVSGFGGDQDSVRAKNTLKIAYRGSGFAVRPYLKGKECLSKWPGRRNLVYLML